MFPSHHHTTIIGGNILDIFKLRAKFPLTPMGAFSILWLWEPPPCEREKPVPNTRLPCPLQILTQQRRWLQVGWGRVAGARARLRLAGGRAVAGDGAPRLSLGCSTPAPAGWETGCQHYRATGNKNGLLGKGRWPFAKKKVRAKKKGKGLNAIFHSFHNLLMMINEDNGKYPTDFSRTQA